VFYLNYLSDNLIFGDILRVIIDGANVAHFGKEDSKPKLSNIFSAVRYLEENNHDFVIISDASLKHEIDDKEKYEKLLADDAIEEVPAGNNADHFILELAEEENAYILSNDLFRDFADEFHDIPSKRLPFSFKGEEIVVGSAKKPKKDKNVLQHICNEILLIVERKRWEVYKGKEGVEFSPLNIAKESIIRMDKSEHDGVGDKLEGIFSKIPMFDKVMDMVEDVESSAPYVIYVLVNPKNYKEAVKNAGNISVTIADRLRLDKRPLIAVRNDLFMRPNKFELNIMYSDEVEQNAPFNVEIKINPHDEAFIKKSSRNIASTIAGRMGTWKFPFVAVNPDIIHEKPGEFEIFLDKTEKNKNKNSKENAKNKYVDKYRFDDDEKSKKENINPVATFKNKLGLWNRNKKDSKNNDNDKDNDVDDNKSTDEKEDKRTKMSNLVKMARDKSNFLNKDDDIIDEKNNDKSDNYKSK